MTNTHPTSALQLQSLVTAAGELQLSLAEVPVPVPGPGEVLLRIQAAPLNPSDLGLLFGAADMTTARASGSSSRPVITATVAPAAMKSRAGRLGQAMPVGNEGSGIVVAAGASPAAQALLGKTIAAYGGAMYAHYQLQVSPQLFAVVTSITIITMVYVGGMASIYGPVGGAILLVLMTELLRNFGEWRLMIYSCTLILILFFLPNGLVAPTWRRLKAALGARE